MTQPFVFVGSDPSGRAVTLADVQRPHGDELTLFRVQIEADGVSASCGVESLGGDHGFLVDPEDTTTELGASTRLSELLSALGTGPLWAGERHWRSLGGELQLRMTVDALGHVDVLFEVGPQPWRPTWSASCVLRYDLGDLAETGRQLAEWFRQSLGQGPLGPPLASA